MDNGWQVSAEGETLEFNAACADNGEINGYLEERAIGVEYRGIRILNYYRPMSSHFRALLDANLRLVYFDEPSPAAGAPLHKAV